MRPEERAYYRAYLKAFPVALVVFFAMVAVAVVLDVGGAVFSVAATAVVTGLFLWLTRSEYRAMRDASRRRGAAERERRRGS